MFLVGNQREYIILNLSHYIPLSYIAHYQTCKRDCSWNPSKCICENSKYLKSITDTSVIECDEIITVMDIASTKKTTKMLQ